MVSTLSKVPWEHTLDGDIDLILNMTDWLHSNLASRWIVRWLINQQTKRGPIPGILNADDDTPASPEAFASQLLSIARTVAQHGVTWVLGHKSLHDIAYPGSVSWPNRQRFPLTIPGTGIILPLDGKLPDLGVDIITWYYPHQCIPPTGEYPDQSAPMICIGWMTHTQTCPPMPALYNILTLDPSWKNMYNADLTTVLARTWTHYLDSGVPVRMTYTPTEDHRRILILE